MGLVIEGALGNVSPSQIRGPQGDLTGDGKVDDYDHVAQMGVDFTTYVGNDIARGGKQLASNEIKAGVTTINHPVTNWGEAGLGIAGMLDRQFLPGTDGGGPPAEYHWSKSTPPGRHCVAAGPTSVNTQIAAYKIGELNVVTAPGELFGTMANVVKSKARSNAFDGGQTMVFGQTNDSLGYIIQDFETDPAGGVTSNAKLGEYEEEFMLDRCFGDHVLQAQLDLAKSLGL